MDFDKYHQTLKLCHLKEEIDKLKFGDETLIGDKGLKITESFKTRISLAWSVYADWDILLMDNFLTALPSYMRKQIIQDVLVDHFRDKTRIIVPYSFHVLPSADRIIALENGSIIFDGTYDELISSEYYKSIAEANLKPVDLKNE